MHCNGYGHESIDKVDETGVTTVHDSERLIANRAIRFVGRIVSAENCLCNQRHRELHPIYVHFPRKSYKFLFINGATPNPKALKMNVAGPMKRSFLSI